MLNIDDVVTNMQTSDFLDLEVPDQDLLEHIKFVNQQCMEFAGKRHLLLSGESKPDGVSPIKYILDGIEQRSLSYCMHFTALAIYIMTRDNSIQKFLNVVPICTHICDDAKNWSYHFQIALQLPSGVWTYLSTGNYTQENIKSHLAFNGYIAKSFIDLIEYLKPLFQVEYPIDIAEVNLNRNGFSQINELINIEWISKDKVLITLPYINCDKIVGIKISKANIHLPIKHS